MAKFIGIALAVFLVVAVVGWYQEGQVVYLIDASQEFSARVTLDLWGPDRDDGRYRVSESILGDTGGYRIYGRRIGPIPWLDNCAVKPDDDGDGFLVSYEEDGKTYFLWSRYSPLEK